MPAQSNPSSGQIPPSKSIFNKANYDAFEQVAQIIFLSALYGVLTCMLCYFGVSVQVSYLGQFVFPFLYDSVNAVTTTLIGHFGFSAGWAPWIMFGLPLAMISYHIIYAICNGELGVSFNKSLIHRVLNCVAYILPYAGFALGWGLFGMTYGSAMIYAFVSGTLAGIFLSDLAQGPLSMVFAKPAAKPEGQDSADTNPAKDPEEKSQPNTLQTENTLVDPAKPITPGFEAARQGKSLANQSSTPNNAKSSDPVAEQQPRREHLNQI